MTTPLVRFTLRGYLTDPLVEDMADPVYATLQETPCEVDGDDLVTCSMLATDPRALVFAASPAIATAVAS